MRVHDMILDALEPLVGLRDQKQASIKDALMRRHRNSWEAIMQVERALNIADLNIPPKPCSARSPETRWYDKVAGHPTASIVLACGGSGGITMHAPAGGR